jgi:SAM-dependent methyltransferase
MNQPRDKDSDPHKIVRRGYDAMAQQYLEWSLGSAVREQWLQTLLAVLPKGARVLDLGCGAGVPVAKCLSEGGHHVVGVDNSPGQIGLARQYVPAAEFVISDFSAAEFDDESFDAIVAFYSITHVRRELHAELFSRILRWLAPGGTFLASLGTNDCVAWSGEWLGAQMFFSHFDAPTNLRLLREAGFIVSREEVIGEEEHGEVATFLWVLTERPC